MISTAGDATLTVHDATGIGVGVWSTAPPFFRSRCERARKRPGGRRGFGTIGGPGAPRTLLTYSGPVSNDAVTLDFEQLIGASDALQPGTYGKALTFTLSTTGPVPMSTTTTLFVSGDVPTRLFLHTGGANLFLDRNVATDATADFRDSAALKFAAGNAWKTIGTWGGAASEWPRTFTAGELRAWLGLKNSDDQGTRFDVRAEVLENGVPIASGTSNCITGVTRNPAQATEVSVPFAGTADIGPADAVSLRVSARIGTNPSGAFCGGHSNATGLRLYFDAATRPAAITFG